MTPALTPGSASMIFFTSSTSALKMPTPVTSLPSEIGQTIDNFPSARSEKFLRTCSQMIFSTPSLFLFGPTFKITTQYFLVVASMRCINSSLIVIIESFSRDCSIHSTDTLYNSAITFWGMVTEQELGQQKQACAGYLEYPFSNQQELGSISQAVPCISLEKGK